LLEGELIMVLDDSARGLRQIRDKSSDKGKGEESKGSIQKEGIHIQTNLNQHLTDVRGNLC